MSVSRFIGPKLTPSFEAIDNLSAAYSVMHNHVFGFSWRILFPIPFIVKPINFKYVAGESKRIHASLQECRRGIETLHPSLNESDQSIASTLVRLVDALGDVVSHLNEVALQRWHKSQKSSSYSEDAYQAAVSRCNSSLTDYMCVAGELNSAGQGWG